MKPKNLILATDATDATDAEPSSTACYIGIDLGDRRNQVCITDSAGKIIKEYTIKNTRPAFLALCDEYPNALVAIEVGTHSPWISRIFQEKGLVIYVANARKLQLVSKNERKSDTRDARLLAKLVRADPTLLYEITHNSEQCQRSRLTIKLRNSLVRTRVQLILGIRGMLKSLEARLPEASTKCFPTKVRELLTLEDAPLLEIIEPTLLTLDTTNEQIKAYDKRIDELIASDYPAAIPLMAICGVGPVTALSFVLQIEDPNRFKEARDVGAYLGLVPRRDQSGATDKQLPISKTGNEEMRRLLVQCSQYILSQHGPDCDLRRHGIKLAQKGGQDIPGQSKSAQRNGGKIAKRKAVIAVARKLAVVMLTLWQKNRTYEPFRAKVGAEDTAMGSNPHQTA